MISVAIDARRLQDEPRFGVGRGLANLLGDIARTVDVTLLADQRRPLPKVSDCKVVALPGFGPLPEPAWLQVSVPRWLRGRDCLFHGTYNAIPFAGSNPSVVTIHDLSWEHHPEDLGYKRWVIARQARFSAHRARFVITVSEFVRQSILETYGLDEESVVVAPNAVDPIFSPAQARLAPAALAKWGVNGPYVVALAGALRRGAEVAVDAWRSATSGLTRRPQLLMVGDQSPPAEPGVVHVGRLNDRDWAAVLAGAETFCYPTRYEGFGMPALEAVASGTPVVCASIGPLPEILGDAAEWCRTPNTPDIADGLRRLLEDDIRRAALRERGLAVAASSPKWSDSAAVVLDAYKRAAET